MTVIRITLHQDTQRLLATPVEIDLDVLTPRARALAEAVAQLPNKRVGGGDIICEHLTKTRAEMAPNAAGFPAEQMQEHARMGWDKWDKYRPDSEVLPIAYLERQALKIPPEWRIVYGRGVACPEPEPVPSTWAGVQ